MTYSTPLCSLTGVDVIEVNLVQSYVGGCVDVIRDGGVSGIPTPLTLVPTKGNLTGQNDYDPPLEPRSTCDYGDLHLTATFDSGCWTAEVVGKYQGLLSY